MDPSRRFFCHNHRWQVPALRISLIRRRCGLRHAACPQSAAVGMRPEGGPAHVAHGQQRTAVIGSLCRAYLGLLASTQSLVWPSSGMQCKLEGPHPVHA
eukprot:10964484-Karenia_brevis.AAC.1